MSEMLFRKQSAPRTTWQLNEDINAGLRMAVDNNQPGLALHYVLAILERQETEIHHLQDALKDQSAKPATKAAKDKV